MWEFSIILNNDDINIADYISGRLSKITKEVGGITSTYSDGDNITISVACKKYDKTRLEFYIIDCITEVICIYYKEIYLNKKLQIVQSDELIMTALKKALINFDKETDSYIVSKNLTIKNSINLNSFMSFKLRYLTEKWAELVRIANENCGIFVSNDTFIELLKFLVDNLETNNDTVNIVYDNSVYKFFDESFIEIDSISYENVSTECSMISNLISLSPRKINMYCNNYHTNVCNLIKQIFYKRVKFLPYESVLNKKVDKMVDNSRNIW